MKLIHQKTKTLETRDNGRSSDAISPNFLYGCLGGCKSYCYMARYNPDKVYINDNIEHILLSISIWANKQPWPKVPNQVDDEYYCVDIGCSTDVALMSKHYNWQKVFDYFNEHPKLKSTFATKYPTRLQQYNIDPKKNRIRVSLMPEVYSDILEPGTDKIQDRIYDIHKLQEQMEVHINYSPIIYHKGWLEEYDMLFQVVKDAGIQVPCECIFLTYNDIQHNRNTAAVNELCWKPEIQEYKNSEYSDNNIRYKWQLKEKMIQEFKQLYGRYFPIDTIRYIF
jgi:spore photoproduct lyase